MNFWFIHWKADVLIFKKIFSIFWIWFIFFWIFFEFRTFSWVFFIFELRFTFFWIFFYFLNLWLKYFFWFFHEFRLIIFWIFFFFKFFIFFTIFFLPEISQIMAFFLEFRIWSFLFFLRSELFRFFWDFLFFLITSISHATRAWQAFLKKGNMKSLLKTWEDFSRHEKKALFGTILCILDLFTRLFLSDNQSRHYTFHDQGLFHLSWLMPLQIASNKTDKIVSAFDRSKSNAVFLTSDNFVSSIFDFIFDVLFASSIKNLSALQLDSKQKNKQNRQCIQRFQHWMQFSTFHHEKRLINKLSQQTIVSVHLIVSRSNAAIWQSNNFVSAFDDFSIRCSSSDIKKNSSVHLISSRSNATIWTSTVFHLIALRLSATVLTSRQSSACIWSFHDRVQHVWHHIQSSVHLITSTSNAATFWHQNQQFVCFIVW